MQVITPDHVLDFLSLRSRFKDGSKYLDSAWMYVYYKMPAQGAPWWWSCWGNAIIMNYNWENI